MPGFRAGFSLSDHDCPRLYLHRPWPLSATAAKKWMRASASARCGSAVDPDPGFPRHRANSNRYRSAPSASAGKGIPIPDSGRPRLPTGGFPSSDVNRVFTGQSRRRFVSTHGKPLACPLVGRDQSAICSMTSGKRLPVASVGDGAMYRLVFLVLSHGKPSGQ